MSLQTTKIKYLKHLSKKRAKKTEFRPVCWPAWPPDQESQYDPYWNLVAQPVSVSGLNSHLPNLNYKTLKEWNILLSLALQKATVCKSEIKVKTVTFFSLRPQIIYHL